MSPISRAKKPDSAASNSSTVRNAIALLSGYLFGATAAHACSPMMEACALGAGAIGMITYTWLSSRTEQRKAQDARRAIETATIKLERRIEQHIRVTSARLMLKLHAAGGTHPWRHEQYMTVARASQTVR
jgi:hypothetical protein